MQIQVSSEKFRAWTRIRLSLFCDHDLEDKALIQGHGQQLVSVAVGWLFYPLSMHDNYRVSILGLAYILWPMLTSEH